ncbi:hypothetical protein L605_001300000340 [Bacillus subtilis J26]|nr:hypothetical protein L607_001200000270 [Bacillus subtilis J24]TWG76226.1 hypothetical protein L605_001300000340 [Bacillus subtilis J26]
MKCKNFLLSATKFEKSELKKGPPAKGLCQPFQQSLLFGYFLRSSSFFEF